MNNNFKDWQELYQWMADGKPIGFDDDVFKPNKNKKYSLIFSHELVMYTKHQEPEKWYQVFAHYKYNARPCCNSNLYKSVEDFLNFVQCKESDYHWIKLIEV